MGTTPSTSNSLDGLVIENRVQASPNTEFTSTLYLVSPDGATETDIAHAVNLANSGTYTLSVKLLAPGATDDLNPAQTSVAKDETLSIALGVDQFSSARLGDKIKAALDTVNPNLPPSVADLGDFLVYSGAKYWHDVDTSSDAIAGLTHTKRIAGVNAALLRASGNLSPSGLTDFELQQTTPFHLFPSSLSLDAFRIANNQDDRVELKGGFLNLADGQVNPEAVQLFVYQYSALEHSIMEEVTYSEGISAVKLLQMAYSKVANAGPPGGLNQIDVLEFQS